MKNFKTSLSVLLLVLVVSLFLYEKVTRPEVSTDAMVQFSAALNLLNDLDYKVMDVNADCENLNLVFMDKFPIGFSVLSAFYLKINNNILNLSRVLYVVSFLLILFFTYKTYKQLFQSKFIVFIGVGLTLFFSLRGTAIDYLAFGLLLSAFYFFSRDKKFDILIASLLLFVTIIFRYAYYPQVVTIGATMLFLSFWNKKPVFTKKLVLHGAILLGLSLVYFTWLKTNMESINRLEDKFPVNHFNAENILHFRAIFVDFFIDTYRVFRLAGMESVGYDRGFDVPVYIRVFLLLVSGVLFILSHVYLWQKQVKSTTNFEKNFLSLLLISSIINIGFIYSLSFYYPSTRTGYIWTWAMLPRYFIINFFVFSVSLIYFFKDNPGFFKKMLLVAIFGFFALNLLDRARLALRVYAISPSENLELTYPNRNVNQLHDFYLDYQNKRNEFCVLIKQNTFSAEQMTSITYFSSLLNYPISVLDDFELENLTEIKVGANSLYLQKRK